MVYVGRHFPNNLGCRESDTQRDDGRLHTRIVANRAEVDIIVTLCTELCCPVAPAGRTVGRVTADTGIVHASVVNAVIGRGALTVRFGFRTSNDYRAQLHNRGHPPVVVAAEREPVAVGLGVSPGEGAARGRELPAEAVHDIEVHATADRGIVGRLVFGVSDAVAVDVGVGGVDDTVAVDVQHRIRVRGRATERRQVVGQVGDICRHVDGRNRSDDLGDEVVRRTRRQGAVLEAVLEAVEHGLQEGGLRLPFGRRGLHRVVADGELQSQENVVAAGATVDHAQCVRVAAREVARSDQEAAHLGDEALESAAFDRRVGIVAPFRAVLVCLLNVGVEDVGYVRDVRRLLVDQAAI